MASPFPEHLPRLVARALVAWLVFGALGYFGGATFTRTVLPLYEVTAEVFLPGFRTRLAVSDDEGPRDILLFARVETPLKLTEQITVPPGREAPPASITVMHSMVPVVILLTVVVAWPATTRTRFALRLAAALAAVLVVQLLVTPPHLAGNFEVGLQTQIARMGGERAEPFVIRWMLFMEGGGRWVLPLVAGIVCILVTEPVRPMRPVEAV